MTLDWKETKDGKGMWAKHGNLRLVVKEHTDSFRVRSYWWGIYEDDELIDSDYLGSEDQAIQRCEIAAGVA